MVLILVLSTTFFSQNVLATTYTWVGGSSGNWTTTSNWSPSTGYPGGTATDIAIINTSSVTITLSSTLTIGQLETTSYGVKLITISVSSGSTLNISSGISTAQPSSASNVFTFAGSGTTKISGTISAGYSASFAVSSGATVYLNASAVVDESTGNPHGNFNNAGTLNILSGATLLFNDQASLINSGTINSYGASFTFSGSGTPTCSLQNTGTITDHGSTLTFSGQNATFQNSAAASTATMHGTTINFSAGLGDNAQNIWNAGQFTIDSAATINGASYTSYVSNGGTFYAGTSNSSCKINLTAQAAYVSNTGTFYLGSTSSITFGGYQAYVANSGTFTIRSDPSGSGAIGTLSNSAYVSGTFNVQRYISGGSSAYRGYRLFSSPVYASTVSGNNVYSLNYVKNSALITGSGGTAGGFDKTGNPSLYLYRENIAYSNATYISGNFRGVANIASAPSYTMDTDGGPYYIPVGNGFLFWFRGDRTTNLANKYTPGTSAESVTMTSTATLNTGQVVVHDWYTPSSANLGYTTTTGNTSVRGDNLVGNPYPSSIDWETFQTTTSTTGIYGKNVSTTTYVLNQTTQNYGTYIKGNGGVGTNNATNIIASGQGFFVTATSTTPQLIFNETAKITSQVTGSNLLMSTSAVTTAINPYLRLQMIMDSVNYDDLLIRFDNSAATAFSQDRDSRYKAGFGKESIYSFSSDNVALAINTQPFPKDSERIRLDVTARADGIYKLTLKDIKQVPRLYDIWLMDAYKKDSLDLRQNHTYNFNIIKSDTNSFGANRFSLIIRQNQAYAYRLLNFTAIKIPGTSVKQVQAAWTTATEGNYTNFTVERSTDGGKTYAIIGSVTGSGQGEYSLTDNQPADHNLYRLKSEDVNNNVTYSSVIPISYSDLSNNLTAGNVSVYPNPASSVINLNIANTLNTANTYNIVITNSSGLVIKQASVNQASWQTSLADFLPGTYVIKVFNPKDGSEIGDAKFVRM